MPLSRFFPKNHLMRCDDISVIIPLYNKRDEIGRTLRSVLSQSRLPREVIVIDDGSTDGSGEVIEQIASPLVRLVRQENRGVSAARNRAMELAEGEWIALLDGDDEWLPDYLESMCALCERFPQARAFGSGFKVRDERGRLSRGRFPAKTGVVDYFQEAMRCHVLIPSATLLHRTTALSLGGFPEGMKLGEDQYLWTLLARKYSVAFLSEEHVIYSRAAQNRSAAIYTPEQSRHSLEELYDESQSKISNDYVARVALGKALTVSAKGGSEEARRALRVFASSRSNRFLWWKVRLLTALPVAWRAGVLALYNRMAWILARKGM